MRGEILAIGDELTSGRVRNTTSSLAARRLFAAAHEILAMTTVGDDPDCIGTALQTALARSQFILVTGGLGATSDDLTNEAVARALNRPLALNHELLAAITRGGNGLNTTGQKGDKTGQPSGRLEKLAWLPAGATSLKPESGMAGHLLVHADVPIFFLPGVPHEMEELLEDCVLPDLAVREKGQPGARRQELYRVFGLTEVEINRRCLATGDGLAGLSIGYYPVDSEVHVSLSLRGADVAAVDSRFQVADRALRTALGHHLFGTGERTMERVVGDLLRQQGATLAMAESCTGGRTAALLTGLAGCSDFFLGGVVAYANLLKERLLGIDPAILEQHGAVSDEVARRMADGIRERTGADIGVAITGIAGPAGGSPEKPVGTVWFGMATAQGSVAHQYLFPGRRWQVQAMAALQALDLVRHHLLGLHEDDDPGIFPRPFSI